MTDPKELAKSLAKLDYGEIKVELVKHDDQTLVAIMNSPRLRLGDTAALILLEREKFDLVADAVLNKKITNKPGKMRALWMFDRQGLAFPRSKDVYWQLLHDRIEEIVYDAMSGLVAFQDPDAIDWIMDSLSRREEGSKIYMAGLRAVDALEKQDPSIFSSRLVPLQPQWRHNSP